MQHQPSCSLARASQFLFVLLFVAFSLEGQFVLCLCLENSETRVRVVGDVAQKNVNTFPVCDSAVCIPFSQKLVVNLIEQYNGLKIAYR